MVDRNQEGLQFKENWDMLGMRLTSSEGVHIENVKSKWQDALGYVNKEFTDTTYRSTEIPSIQLVINILIHM